MRPCNKLPAVQCRNGYRRTSVCHLFCTTKRNKSLSLRRGGRRCLRSKLDTKLYADGEVYVFVWIAYGSSFFNRNNYYHLSGGYTASSPQGEPLSIITFKKSRKQVIALQVEIRSRYFGNGPNKDFYLTLHN